MEIRRFGFFDDIPDGALQLQRTRQATARPDEGQVLHYLRTGTQVMAVAGVSCDLLSDEQEVIGPPHIFTDGEWCWSADTVYYLERYHIEVPEDFVKRMRDNGWVCPRVDETESIATSLWE